MAFPFDVPSAAPAQGAQADSAAQQPNSNSNPNRAPLSNLTPAISSVRAPARAPSSPASTFQVAPVSHEIRSWPTPGQTDDSRAKQLDASALIQHLTRPGAARNFNTGDSQEFDTFGPRSRAALTSHQNQGNPQGGQRAPSAQPQYDANGNLIAADANQNRGTGQRTSVAIAQDFVSGSQSMAQSFDTALPEAQLEKLMADGDTRGIHSALRAAHNATLTQAIAGVFDLLPQIYEMFEARVMGNVNTVRETDSTWGDFSQYYPDYGNFRHIVEPTLKAALQAPNASKDAMFEAVARIHAGLITANGARPSWEQDQLDQNNYNGSRRRDTGFNLNEFLSSDR